MGPYLLIALGGVAGANTRYLVSTWAANRVGVDFPYGTLLINASGSVLIGFFLTMVAGGGGHDPDARFLVATGFLGAYTTFSTFTYETIALMRRAAIRASLINVIGSATSGIGGAVVGIALANMFVRGW